MRRFAATVRPKSAPKKWGTLNGYRPTMDIHSPPGTKVVFTGKNGSAYDQEFAQKNLGIGSLYEVAHIAVGAWHTDVFFKEVPGKGFNSVMFAHLEDWENGP